MYQSEPKVEYIDEIDKLIKIHQKEAEDTFVAYRTTRVKELELDLLSIESELKKQLSSVCKKLYSKIKNNYTSGSLNTNAMKFYLQPYVAKESQNVNRSVVKLKQKILEYIQNFSTTILQKNIQRLNQISLFYTENKIKNVGNQWHSVTSRSPCERAEIIVSGLRRPETSWLVLGVSKKKKEYGPVAKSINNEQFLGNIYLNGSDTLSGQYKLKKDLSENDVFVIQNLSRMIYVYRKKQGKNMDDAFILDDNVDYFFYIAVKGPLTLEFRGE